MKNEINKKLLVVWDFDGTIVSGHTHNTINRSKNTNDPEYSNGAWAAVHHFSIIGPMDTWKNIFESLNQQGHYTAINSFNSYGHIIPEFLEKIGLDEDSIKKVHIIAKLPANPAKENKNPYIEQSIAKFKKDDKSFSGNPADVILIDDSRNNIEAAQVAGYQVIRAKKDASHLIELQKKLEELKKLEEKAPPVDRNAKPKKQLSESELRLKIETLKKQREELVKQKEELEKLTKDRLEKINIYSNSEKILFNDPKLDKLDLAYKANYDQLSEVTSKLSKLQSQLHVEDSKQAVVSKKVIEQSPQQTVDLSQVEQLKQEIEKYKNIRKENIENIEKISKIFLKQKLSSEEDSTISALKSDLLQITEVIKVKEECLRQIEKPDALVVDDDSKPKRFETNSKNQGAVPKKKPNADKPQINLLTKLQERSDQILKDRSKAISEPDSKPTHKKLEELKKQELEDLLKAQPKNANRLEDSTDQQSAVSNTTFRNELEKKLKERQTMQGTSTFFPSSNSSTSNNKTKAPLLPPKQLRQ